ncbi:cytochrome c oxidase assembly protein [Paenibacillus daejeonensis]|uniref:cytochrome c oxidase assembly protein n=1 Tax=Paenibacillus daejeonensis TaxID=135193 RepID=UPI000368BF05|nr:cytochrome c oxidase assembly protein [Paenibacillus daejeonensis]
MDAIHDGADQHHHPEPASSLPADGTASEVLAIALQSAPFLLLAAIYPVAAALSARRYGPWPQHRVLFWLLGVMTAGASLVGPLATASHHSFEAHMAAHLLLGMLAPLFIVLSFPVTLLLRTLRTPTARRLSGVLRAKPLQWITHPVTAAVLNVGGLAFLYLTNLYHLMHENVLIYGLVHVHIFLAAYVFTASILYTDPAPHRKSYPYRAVVLVLALAAHGMLAKYLYAHPPVGVPSAQAEAGSMLMYYGGDVVHIAIILLFCRQWYRSAGHALAAKKARLEPEV